MKKTIDFNDFQNEFEQMGRKDSFSYDGLKLLFDMFEETDENTELDVIAIDCDFSENDWETILLEYDDIDISECESIDEIIDTIESYLSDNTYLVGKTDDSFVYQAF
ncbi:MAG: hypothetical protein ACYDBX_02365 [Patescibacteria group bacterium]